MFRATVFRTNGIWQMSRICGRKVRLLGMDANEHISGHFSCCFHLSLISPFANLTILCFMKEILIIYHFYKL